MDEVPQGVSIGAVVLLDKDRCSATLLELPLLMETPETTLDQDGCQGHPLIKCILGEKTAVCYKPSSFVMMNSEYTGILFLLNQCFRYKNPETKQMNL